MVANPARTQDIIQFANDFEPGRRSERFRFAFYYHCATEHDLEHWADGYAGAVAATRRPLTANNSPSAVALYQDVMLVEDAGQTQ